MTTSWESTFLGTQSVIYGKSHLFKQQQWLEFTHTQRSARCAAQGLVARSPNHRLHGVGAAATVPAGDLTSEKVGTAVGPE